MAKSSRVDAGTGAKKRYKYNNSDSTSPIVSIEAVLISAVIDVYEKQNMEVVDIQGTYLSANLDDDVFMIFRGTVAELMVASNPIFYRKYISYGKK